MTVLPKCPPQHRFPASNPLPQNWEGWSFGMVGLPLPICLGAQSLVGFIAESADRLQQLIGAT